MEGRDRAPKDIAHMPVLCMFGFFISREDRLTLCAARYREPQCRVSAETVCRGKSLVLAKTRQKSLVSAKTVYRGKSWASGKDCL